jgi:hypothetical protein
MRMSGGLVLVDEAGKFEQGKRIHLGEMGKDEAWLRDRLFASPEILPIEDVDSDFAPLVPLCKELRTDAGVIDAAFINARGRLTIVEFKLWSNPQARREVVAQTLDYVSALARWSYDDLQRQVSTAVGRQGNIPYETARKRTPALREREFIDAVNRSLREGRLLVLIAGDGIREGVQSLTELVSRNPTKSFSFGLIEVALYRFSKNRMAIQPRVLAKTEVVTRHVTIIRDDSNAIQVNGDAEELESAEDRMVSRDKARFRRWWRPLLDMEFDDPEQERPFWTGTNNLVLRTPFPGIRIKAASLRDRDHIEVFVSYTRKDNAGMLNEFVKRDRRYLKSSLPPDTVVDPQRDWPIVWRNQDPLSDDDKRTSLKETLNTFVTVLRPRLKEWYEETQG